MRYSILSAALFGLCLNSVTASPSGDAMTRNFQSLDQDGNGMISQHEVTANPAVVRGLHLYGDSGFYHADRDGNGGVDEAEFSAFEELISAE